MNLVYLPYPVCDRAACDRFIIQFIGSCLFLGIPIFVDAAHAFNVEVVLFSVNKTQMHAGQAHDQLSQCVSSLTCGLLR